VRHPDRIWADPTFASESLARLKEEWVRHLQGRAKATSPHTIQKYQYSVVHFIKSLIEHGEPTTLASLTPANVDTWVADQRERGMSEDGIASRLTALKVFSNKYIYKHVEATVGDLLAKVERITPPEKPMPALTDEEQESLLSCFNRYSFEDVRNKALLAVFLATGLRLAGVMNIGMAEYDRLTGDISVVGKGEKWRKVRLSDRAMKLVRSYLRIRPENACENLWVQGDGKLLTYWAGQSIFRRLKQRSGVGHVHAHLLRHNFAKKALANGVERGVLQDMLGHSSSVMTNRYLGNERKEQAAALMPRYAPI
jgi:integrase/recombinase XerD